MSDTFSVKKIAVVKGGFSDKFGIPRQSGLCNSVKSQVIFEPDYRVPEAVRGLEGFSHIWLIWQFSEAVRDDWSPTVRPPRLGGNKRIGVFATRSPFRPNPLGLSCVKLEKIEHHAELGPILHISGADLLNDTPIYDIKPYIPYADCKTEASDGFLADNAKRTLTVSFSDGAAEDISQDLINCITEIITEDPRPAYQNDPERVYKMSYSGYSVSFFVTDGHATVTEISEEK